MAKKKMPAAVKSKFKAKSKARGTTNAPKTNGLTAKQRAKLPPALQKAIAAKNRRKSK